MKIDKRKQIIEWLLNGVTIGEIQERLSWLGMIVTIEEIKKIMESVKAV